MTLPIGIQLYTVRESAKDDFPGTMKALADIGYRNIEGGHYGPEKAPEVKETFESLGLKIVGAHVGLNLFEEQLNAVGDEAEMMGYKHVVLPFAKETSAEGWKRIAGILNDAAKVLGDRGLRVHYHNHAHEFETLADGSRPFDVLVNEMDADTTSFELDVMWVNKGGEDPVAWINKLAGRVQLLHIKDMPAPDSGSDARFTEVGTGCVDIPGVIQAANKAGTEYLLIEQDNDWTGTPIDSARISFENLSKMVGG